MITVLERTLVAIASGSLLAGALVLQAGAAHAVSVGSLTVAPTSGSDASLLTLATGSTCTDSSATYVSVAISGSGFAAGGTNVVGAAQISDLTHSATGYVIQVSNTLAAIASLQHPAVTYVGDYTFDVKCRLALDFTSLGDFTATIHFSDPHTWSVVSGTAPHFTIAAHLTGTARVGYTSGCSASVTGSTSLQYVWLRNGVTISGATHSTYVVQPADNAHTLACELIAKNAAGSTTSKAAARYVEPGYLHNVVHPTLSGHAIHGYTLACRAGAWSPAPSHYAYGWLLNGVHIRGAAASTLKLATTYKAHTIACQVTASKTGYLSVTVRTSAVKVS